MHEEVSLYIATQKGVEQVFEKDSFWHHTPSHHTNLFVLTSCFTSEEIGLSGSTGHQDSTLTQERQGAVTAAQAHARTHTHCF